MKAALWSTISAILYGWIIALFSLLRRLKRDIAHKKADDRDERESNRSRSTCVPIRDPAYVRPDPLIYSQKFLKEQGLNVTWQNPDFFIMRDGVEVDSSDLLPATRYDVVVRVWNGSVDGPVVAMPVHLSFLSFGAGTQLHAIQSQQIDVGVKGGANEPAFVSFEWTTPGDDGHYCLQALLDPADDAQFGNNLGQHNTNVVKTQSPGVFAFALGNDTPRSHEYHFATDTYELPSPEPCPDDKKWENDPSNPIASVHSRDHPLPPGWTVDIAPELLTLDPGEQRHIMVTVTPPDGFAGDQVLNVHALYRENYEDRVAGGVTVTIVQEP